mmetsp:Transcript_22288/g.66455  ORF Transcript_22288/g.66455 Transcript_22288/m.66455 type:complete len:313 (+) Transcript_22288:1128-2066(+)
MCRAHAHNARVLINAGHSKSTGKDDMMRALEDETVRKAWIDNMVCKAQLLHLDGINFDLEEPTTPGSVLARNYSRLVQDTAKCFHDNIHGSQVSVDVPWSPYDIDGRNYDWAGLFESADRLFVMSYDMQSQVYDMCMAMSNSPAPLVKRGLQQWLDLGAPPSKLILGLPWYGYDYPCEAGAGGGPMGPTDDICMLKLVPFRGAPCSDAAGAQKGYTEIMSLLHSGRNTTAVRWDDIQDSPYFNYLSDDGKIHQVRFDNPNSLRIKYKIAVDLGLRGVGMWNLDTLDYDDTDPQVQQETAAMWDALKTFTQHE